MSQAALLRDLWYSIQQKATQHYNSPADPHEIDGDFSAVTGSGSYWLEGRNGFVAERVGTSLESTRH